MSASWFTTLDRQTHRQLTVPTLTNMQLNEFILIQMWFFKPGKFQSPS